MSQDMISRYRRWFEYEQDAHAKVLRSLETVPSDRRSAPEFRRAVAILAHVIAARRMWLGRLGVIPLSPAPLFPEGTGLGPLAEELRAFHRQALHAARLELAHPLTGKELEWKAPPPEDMQRLLTTLEADQA